MYWITGGVFTSTDFDELEPGTEETYGPFADFEQAYQTWSGKARGNMDTCCHRLIITSNDPGHDGY